MTDVRLICFDFDLTLVNGHYHSELVRKGVMPNEMSPGVQVMQENGSFLRRVPNSDSLVMVPTGRGATPSQIQQLLFDFSPKNRNEIAQIICQAIDNGHKIAIVSFTKYPEVVVPTLKTILFSERNPDKYIKEICIVAGFPSDNNPKDSPLGKQEHIAEAAQYFNKKGFFIKPTNIMLVEDTKRNLVIAQKEQIYPVFVSDLPNPNPKTYVPEILKFVKKNVNTKVLKIRLPREMPSVDLILTALSHHTKVVWETRGKGREQLVSEVMTNHQAKALQSKIHPNLNPLIVETRNKEGFRVLIETDIAFKYQTDIMFNPPLAKNFPDMNALLYTIQPVVDFHVPKNNRFETNFLLVLLHNYNLVSGSVKQFESRSTGGKIIEYISEKYDNNLLGNIQIETDIKKLSELIQGFHIDVPLGSIQALKTGDEKFLRLVISASLVEDLTKDLTKIKKFMNAGRERLTTDQIDVNDNFIIFKIAEESVFEYLSSNLKPKVSKLF